MKIRLVKRADIVKEKWDGCVHYAHNGNVFGYTWYLDTVAKDWVGLVEGDYLSVFPLVYQKQWNGTMELYQPPLMRSMGIYSVKVLSAIRIQSFLEAIPSQYKKIDITLGERNRPPRDESFKVLPLQNHIVPLHESYETISKKYTDGFKSRLDHSEDQELQAMPSVKPEKMAGWFREFGKATKGVDAQFHALQRIMYNVMHRGTGFATGIQHPDTAEMLAANFYIFSHGRMLSLLPLVRPGTEDSGAMELLLDLMIRSNVKRPLVLDFNTNKKEDLLTSIGAQVETFYRIKRSRNILGLSY